MSEASRKDGRVAKSYGKFPRAPETLDDTKVVDSHGGEKDLR